MAVVCVRLPAVSEGGAPNTVNHNEKHEHHDIHNGYLTPLTFQIFQNASFARIAVKAKPGLVVAPSIAIRINAAY
jgi:hypothetical protein